MAVLYNDSEGAPHVFETEDAGGGAERVVHGLPASITTAIGGTATATAALAAIINTGKLLVADSSAAALAAIISGGRLLTTEASGASIKAAVEALAAIISGGRLLTTEASGAAILAILGVPSGGPKLNQVGSIGTGADVQFSSQALTHGMYIKNASTAGQLLYLSHAATPSSSNGWTLQPGEVTPFIECSNATAVFMRASASGGAASYEGA